MLISPTQLLVCEGCRIVGAPRRNMLKKRKEMADWWFSNVLYIGLSVRIN